MKPIRSTPLAGLAAAGCTFALGAALHHPAWAQDPHREHTSHHGTAAAAKASPTAAAETWTNAEVRRIDKAGKRLTLRHEPIKHLDMPAMTMVFRVQDEALLDRASVGERVRVQVKLENDQYIVTALEPERK
ncbi:MAG: copper-binding protein [Casimicrobiaceae bacterium]